MSPGKTPDPMVTSAIQLETVMDAMVESMIVIDEVGIIEQVNLATLRMFGYTRDELVGANISMLMLAADQSRHNRHLERYKQTRQQRIIGSSREVQAAHKDDSLFPADIAVGEIRTADTARYVGLVRDLTEQRKTEEAALKQREEMVSVS